MPTWFGKWLQLFYSWTLLWEITVGHSTTLIPPPLPVLPIPRSRQLQWQLESIAIFFHFGPNTFTDSEWGTGQANPSVFNPDRFNASQWVQVIKESGFNKVIITAKHHDGFCLWPSSYTNYSVKSSSWRDGRGDVVQDLAVAAKEAGVGLGIYLSPWDRHESRYGKSREYNEFYLAQMAELLTSYGEIKEVFLDGAKGDGEKDMDYFFDDWFSLIHQLQPGAAIFSDIGPDARWIGDENGVAGSTCWSLFNSSDAKIGATDSWYLQMGDPFGHDWVPAECDVSIRPGWFWHEAEAPKSALQLMEIYYQSAGRNCLMLLNVPPNSSGLISSEDIEVLKQFSDLRASIFSSNLARKATISASSVRGHGNGGSQFDPSNIIEEGIDLYWAPEEDGSYDWTLHLKFEDQVSFNLFKVQEPIHMGQRIIRFHLSYLAADGCWRTVANGTTVGYQRLLLFPAVETDQLKFVIGAARAVPLISFLGLYMDQLSNSTHFVHHNQEPQQCQGVDIEIMNPNHYQIASS